MICRRCNSQVEYKWARHKMFCGSCLSSVYELSNRETEFLKFVRSAWREQDPDHNLVILRNPEVKLKI